MRTLDQTIENCERERSSWGETGTFTAYSLAKVSSMSDPHQLTAELLWRHLIRWIDIRKTDHPFLKSYSLIPPFHSQAFPCLLPKSSEISNTYPCTSSFSFQSYHWLLCIRSWKLHIITSLAGWDCLLQSCCCWVKKLGTDIVAVAVTLLLGPESFAACCRCISCTTYEDKSALIFKLFALSIFRVISKVMMRDIMYVRDGIVLLCFFRQAAFENVDNG